MPFVYMELNEVEKAHYAKQLQGWSAGWYIDRERDISVFEGLDAGHWQEIAEGNYNHKIRLRLGDNFFHFIIRPGVGSVHFSDVPYVIVWDSITSYFPENLYGHDYANIIQILKEALSALGGGYENNTKWHPNFIVKFNF